MSHAPRHSWLLFDYDDTLGGVLHDGEVRNNEVAYLLAQDAFNARMETLGFDPKHSEATRSDTDIHLVNERGFSWKPRFAETMERTYKALCSQTQQDIDPVIGAELYAIGMSVFGYRYMPLPGALFALHALRPHYNIAVVTKGEQEEQMKKVVDSGVSAYVDKTIVVGRKDTKDWQHVIDTLNINDELGTTWAIGNSSKGDVNVPLRMGMNAIHVNQGGWAFEKEAYETPRDGCDLIVVDTIQEVLKHLPWS